MAGLVSLLPRFDFRWGVDRSIMGFRPDERKLQVVDLKAMAAELIGMFTFVAVGCGTACSNGAYDAQTRTVVAFAFGMAIMVIAYSIGHHSGGHLNCAVTFSLVLGGQVHWAQGLGNLFCQLLGSLLGAALLCIIFPCDGDLTTNLASNIIDHEYASEGRAVVSEAFGTFLLCFTVWETAVTPKASCGKNACIAIGFAVFLAHVILIPIDGCSINPTRSTGPAIISALRSCENLTEGALHDLWVMWVGPLLGATIAAVFQYPGWPKQVETPSAK
jgi:MIP family channel proteins